MDDHNFSSFQWDKSEMSKLSQEVASRNEFNSQATGPLYNVGLRSQSFLQTCIPMSKHAGVSH